MKLIPNWREAYRWWSVRALAAVAALPIVWPTLPAEVRAWVPETWQPWIIVLLAAGGILGRVVDQTPKGGQA